MDEVGLNVEHRITIAIAICNRSKTANETKKNLDAKPSRQSKKYHHFDLSASNNADCNATTTPKVTLGINTSSKCLQRHEKQVGRGVLMSTC